METQTLTVSSNWLDSNVPTIVNNESTDFIQSNTAKCYYSIAGNNYYPYVTYWPYSYTPKIQLKLSEIEKLRKLAKGNSDIKEILNKFTAHIEVLVDF